MPAPSDGSRFDTEHRPAGIAGGPLHTSLRQWPRVCSVAGCITDGPLPADVWLSGKWRRWRWDPNARKAVARLFQEAGYATACMGKWHLGWDAVNHPHHRGFDEFFGFLGGQHDYFDPNVGHVGVGMDSNGQAPVLEGMEPVDQIKYLTEEITDRAIDFLRRTGDAGLSPLRSPTMQCTVRCKPRRTISPGTTAVLSARDTLLAMLASLDDNVGRLLTALEDLKLADDTFVFYMGDNGGTPTADNWKLRAAKGISSKGGSVYQLSPAGPGG